MSNVVNMKNNSFIKLRGNDTAWVLREDGKFEFAMPGFKEGVPAHVVAMTACAMRILNDPDFVKKMCDEFATGKNC